MDLSYEYWLIPIAVTMEYTTTTITTISSGSSNSTRPLGSILGGLGVQVIFGDQLIIFPIIIPMRWQVVGHNLFLGSGSGKLFFLGQNWADLLSLYSPLSSWKGGSLHRGQRSPGCWQGGVSGLLGKEPSHTRREGSWLGEFPLISGTCSSLVLLWPVSLWGLWVFRIDKDHRPISLCLNLASPLHSAGSFGGGRGESTACFFLVGKIRQDQYWYSDYEESLAS